MSNMPRVTAKISVFALLLVAVFFSSARAADTTQPKQVWHPDQFVVSFWCGPPDGFVTRERYQQIADAGFNTVMPTCHPTSLELNKTILRSAYETHLKAYIQDDRMPMSLADPKAKANLDAIVADYSQFPGLGGYFLGDEPSPPSFAGMGQVVDYLRQKDPTHPVFINLLPGYPGGMIGKDYENYVNGFISIAHPWIVSYDHYHFTTGGDAPWWFENLETVARISKANDLSFFNIVLATQHLIYRRLTEPEKRFEAMQTLAFGARGLLWFTYWQPDASGMWKDAIINFDGTPTYQYDQIKRINHEMAAFGNALLHADWIHTWITNPPRLTIKFDNPQAHWTVGFFKQGWTRMLFIANQDYKNTVRSDLHIQTGGATIERFDLYTQKFVSDDATHLQLGPAEAALYRWQFKE
jgi:hypothetical protein